jgi:hypothetical protein
MICCFLESFAIGLIPLSEGLILPLGGNGGFGENFLWCLPRPGSGVTCLPKVPCRGKIKSAPPTASGVGVTRHPGTGAACERRVSARELVENESS